MLERKKFDKYVEVQMSGKYNMFSAEARLATGLTPTEYSDVLKNYSTYKDTYGCAYNIIKDVKAFEKLPTFIETSKHTDIMYFDEYGYSKPITTDIRNEVYRIESTLNGLVYAIIDTGRTLNIPYMRSFLFSSYLDPDEPIYAEAYGKAFASQHERVLTYAYVVNNTWNIEEMGSIGIIETDGRIIRTD